MRTSDFSKTMRIQRKPSSSIKRVWREGRRSSKNIDRLPFAAKLSKLKPLVASSMAIRILGRESSSSIGGTCVECGDWGAAAAPSLQYNCQSFATRLFFYRSRIGSKSIISLPGSLLPYSPIHATASSSDRLPATLFSTPYGFPSPR